MLLDLRQCAGHGTACEIVRPSVVALPSPFIICLGTVWCWSKHYLSWLRNGQEISVSFSVPFSLLYLMVTVIPVWYTQPSFIGRFAVSFHPGILSGKIK